MTNNLTDRIATIITNHPFGVRQWRDGYRHSSCMCPEEIGANEHPTHVAEAIVGTLGIKGIITDTPPKPRIYTDADAEAWTDWDQTHDHTYNGDDDD